MAIVQTMQGPLDTGRLQTRDIDFKTLQWEELNLLIMEIGEEIRSMKGQLAMWDDPEVEGYDPDWVRRTKASLQWRESNRKFLLKERQERETRYRIAMDAQQDSMFVDAARVLLSDTEFEDIRHEALMRLNDMYGG